MENIYKEIVLDHYKYPRNYGLIQKPDSRAKEENIFCGDSVEISLKFDGKKIKDIKFKGKGCVISQAAASILTDYIKGKPLKKAGKMTTEDLLKLLGIALSPTRMKCAELPLITLKKALKLP